MHPHRPASGSSHDRGTRSAQGRYPLAIWGLGLGYFAWYVPYVLTIVAITRGLLPGTHSISGFELLPSTALATAVVMFALITGMGWWRYAGRRRVLGHNLPFPGRWPGLAGLGFAVVVPTTTLAYTWPGISILLAILLLRGGVLMLAPLVDALCGRRVRWFSWAALGLSVSAWAVAFADVHSYRLTWLAAFNTVAYLSGYMLRLPCMTLGAKCVERRVTLRFFVEEQMVAMPAMVAGLACLALIGDGPIGTDLRRGFGVFFHTEAIWPALLVGAAYACLAVCGTLIYLDARENTFCIPLNRCASVLSVVVATYLLHMMFGRPAPSDSQLAGAALIIVALLLLSPLHHADRYLSSAWNALARRRRRPAPVLASAIPAAAAAGLAHRGLQRLFLFVCSGNTSRSPMAEAICRAQIAALLGVPGDRLPAMNVDVLSAGLSTRTGTPMTEEAHHALENLGLMRPEHTARDLTAELTRRAEVIFCMTAQQVVAVRLRFPEAADKVERLDPDADVEDPAGRGPEAFRECAARLEHLVRSRFSHIRFAT